jgi:hypothetical protein
VVDFQAFVIAPSEGFTPFTAAVPESVERPSYLTAGEAEAAGVLLENIPSGDLHPSIPHESPNTIANCSFRATICAPPCPNAIHARGMPLENPGLLARAAARPNSSGN